MNHHLPIRSSPFWIFKDARIAWFLHKHLPKILKPSLFFFLLILYADVIMKYTSFFSVAVGHSTILLGPTYILWQLTSWTRWRQKLQRATQHICPVGQLPFLDGSCAINSLVSCLSTAYSLLGTTLWLRDIVSLPRFFKREKGQSKKCARAYLLWGAYIKTFSQSIRKGRL